MSALRQRQTNQSAARRTVERPVLTGRRPNVRLVPEAEILRRSRD